MKAVIVLPGATGMNAPPHDLEDACVIAADGGANVLRDWRVRPDLIVGDMDSADEDVVRAFEAEGTRVDRHAHRKDQTDAQLALDHALGMGAREIVLIGTAGGRMDHALGNVHLLYRGAAAGARMRAIEPHARVWTVSPDMPLDLDLSPGDTFSVLPLSHHVTGVTVGGAEYPLQDAVMRLGEPYGISNVAQAPRQRVSCVEGILMVIRPL